MVATSPSRPHASATSGLQRYGFGDLAIPLFIFTTVALDESHVLNSASQVILVGVFILDLLSGRKLTLNPFLWAAGLFLTVSAASLMWTVAPEDSSARVLTFAYQFASYFALMNLISWRRQRLESCLSWTIVGALAAGVQVTLIEGVVFQESRSVEGVISPGQLALACAAGIAISVYRLSTTRRSWYWAVIAILGVFLTLTSGRRGFIIVVLFLVAFFLLSAKHLSAKIGALLAGAAVLFVGYALVRYNPFFHSYVGYRLESFIGFLSGDAPGDASSQGRDRLINFGLGLFQQSPLFGHGIDSFRYQFQHSGGAWNTSADNNYVELLVDLGVVGFLAYYIPLAIFLIRGLHGVSSKGPDVRFAIAFVLSMAVMDFASVRFFSNVGMLIIVICYMVVHQSRTVDPVPERQNSPRPTHRWSTR